MIAKGKVSGSRLGLWDRELSRARSGPNRARISDELDGSIRTSIHERWREASLLLVDALVVHERTGLPWYLTDLVRAELVMLRSSYAGRHLSPLLRSAWLSSRLVRFPSLALRCFPAPISCHLLVPSLPTLRSRTDRSSTDELILSPGRSSAQGSLLSGVEGVSAQEPMGQEKVMPGLCNKSFQSVLLCASSCTHPQECSS